MTNFHDLLSLMCPDFQLRVVKSAFKAAWVVLKGNGTADFAHALQQRLPLLVHAMQRSAYNKEVHLPKILVVMQTDRAPLHSPSCRSKSSGSAWS